MSKHSACPQVSLDAGESKRIVAQAAVRINDVRRIAELVWEGGVDEIDRFVEIALSDAPFPI